MIALHVFLGLLSICSGAIALGVAKGSRLHSRSGQVFAGAMLLMAGTGLSLTLWHVNSSSRLNGIAATLTAYLVLTGFLTVRRKEQRYRWIDALLSAVALGVSSVSISFGFEANATGNGPPAPAFIFFGGFALLGFAGDMRGLIWGTTGARRLARHLWRMGAALWIATASFFLGQAQVFPEFVRKPAILALPVLLVLAVVVYWFVLVKRQRWPRRVDMKISP